MDNSNAMEKRGSSLPVKSVQEIQELGTLFERSGMFGCNGQGQGTVLVMSCIMANMNPLEFQGKYHLVEGRPTMRADAMLAEFNRRGGKHKVVARTADKASVELTTKDGAKSVFSFTWDEAKKEPFVYKKDGKTLKHNWASPRGRMQMLWARAVSDGVRTVDPGVCQGHYTPEEVGDFAEMDAPAPKYEPPAAIKEEPPKPPKSKAGAAKPEPEKEAAKETEAKADTPPENGNVQDGEFEEEVDYDIIPAGAHVNKRWSDLPLDVLQSAAKSRHSSIKDGHKDAIKRELEKREKAKK